MASNFAEMLRHATVVGAVAFGAAIKRTGPDVVWKLTGFEVGARGTGEGLGDSAAVAAGFDGGFAVSAETFVAATFAAMFSAGKNISAYL